MSHAYRQDLNWLINDFTARVTDVAHAAVVSADGVPLALSDGIPEYFAENLAAITAGLASLMAGAARIFKAGLPTQAFVEMVGGLMIIKAVSDGSNLCVLAAPDCDTELVSYEMSLLVEAVGEVLSPALRGGVSQRYLPASAGKDHRMASPSSKLNLDPASVLLARELARRAGEPVTQLARTHTTVSVERAVLRLGGLGGADPGGMPWVNRLTDAVRESVGLEHGVALPVWAALDAGGYPDLRTLAQAAAAGQVRFRIPAGRAASGARERTVRSISCSLSIIDAQRARRDRMSADLGQPPFPWVYLTVATGDVSTDIPQAQAAAREGADVIAVIRPAAQSLLDYVPEGATRDKETGTYATRQSFRLMRAALDQTSRELGRYVRLTNYASGLCMPEIAALAGLERLDLMLSDCLHGIIVRDLNPVRTFIDQRFSRAILARAGIVVSPGEDNFLTPADADDAAPTVIVSQLLNEYFGREAGLETWQLGFGHGLEIDPAVPDSFLLELAQAQLVRELFPGAPLKYMPPTANVTGNMPAGCLLDAFFNLAGLMTDQSILCVGLMPAGIHLPFRADRDVALANVRYVRTAAGRLGLSFMPDSFVVDRAHQVLGDAVGLLRRISTEGLLNSIADGTFGATRRPPDGGRGLDGVVARAERYFNPVTGLLEGTDTGARGDPMAELI